jgi:hypothetical protein
MTPDKIMFYFEIGAVVASFLNVFEAIQSKHVSGVSIVAQAFWSVYGLVQLYFVFALKQHWTIVALFLHSMLTIWYFFLVLKYRKL